MAMRVRMSDHRGDPAEAEALRVLFEYGTDWFHEAADYYGLGDARDHVDALRKLAEAKWPVYGKRFLSTRFRMDRPEGPWAVKKFGLPK